MLEIAILNRHQHLQKRINRHSFSIGSSRADSDDRLVIQDDLISPLQCTIDVLDEFKVRIQNHGHSIVLSTGPRIHGGVETTLELPVSLMIGETQIQLFESERRHPLDFSLIELPLRGSETHHAVGQSPDVSPQPETLASWFDTLGQLQRSAAGTKLFFNEAARAVFNPGGMDAAIVLQKEDDEWSTVGHFFPYPDYGIGFRRDLVEMAVNKRAIVCHDAHQIEQHEAMEDLHGAVVCPVVEEGQPVTAVIYGFRSQFRRNNRRGIRRLEARFVGLVADSVSAGLARLEREADTARKRILLEQAFAPEIARRLEFNPQILDGRFHDVSVLFADLRNFSRISEVIGAKETFRLLTAVMDRFCEVIRRNDGMIIDFYGDGLAAFWNAPIDQEDHPSMACHAGKQILDVIPELNEDWAVRIKQNLKVGIGIHSGMAQVGNSGSSTRLKYGPQGNTVNLASRLESATKVVGVNLLLSGDTAHRVSDDFLPQRVCRAQMQGIHQTTDLFRLVAHAEYASRPDFYQDYDQALEFFEANEYEKALLLIEQTEAKHDADGPLEMLTKHCLNQLQSPLHDKHEPTDGNATIRLITSSH